MKLTIKFSFSFENSFKFILDIIRFKSKVSFLTPKKKWKSQTLWELLNATLCKNIPFTYFNRNISCYYLAKVIDICDTRLFELNFYFSKIKEKREHWTYNIYVHTRMLRRGDKNKNCLAQSVIFSFVSISYVFLYVVYICTYCT